MSDTKDQDDETTIKRFNPTAMLAELRQVVTQMNHGAPGYLPLRGALDLCEHLIADRRIDERLFTEGMLAQAMAKVTRAKIALRYLNREAPKDLIDLDQTDTVSALAEEHARRLEAEGREGEARADRELIEREIERLRPVMLAVMKWCRAPIGIETWNASNALREAFESFASNGMLARFLEEPAKVDPPNPDRTLNREEAREELRKLGMPDVGIDFYLSDPRTYAGAFREPYDSIIVAHARWLDAEMKKAAKTFESLPKGDP